ncbi:MAG: hypothetical protein ACI9G1_002600 [Pirellulaceae bacterium]|jgi:hypothetical protein
MDLVPSVSQIWIVELAGLYGWKLAAFGPGTIWSLSSSRPF